MLRPLNAEEGETKTEVPHEEGDSNTEVPKEEGDPDTEVPHGEMPSATSNLWELVEVLPNWKCKFCGNDYEAMIMAQFARVGGYAIHGCKFANALKALRGERVVELSSRQGNVEEGLHQPMAASNEDASRETSTAAMPYLSSGAGSSTFHNWLEKNLLSQSFLALTNMPRLLNAEDGEPNTKVPHGRIGCSTFKLWELVEVLPNWKCKFCGIKYDARIMACFARHGGYGIHGCKFADAVKALQAERVVELSNKQGNVEKVLYQPVTASNEDASREASIAAMPYLSSGAGEMTRAMDTLSELVEVLPDNKQKRNFCGNDFVGGTNKIKAHFAGVGGLGIRDCNIFDNRVRSEAQEAPKGERALESSNGQGNDECSYNFTRGSHQPLTASNEYARSLSFGAGSSAYLFLLEENLLCQSFPAFTNMLHPLNAEDGEPNSGVPHGETLAESQPGTRRFADQNMASLKRKLEELISGRQVEMSKLKSKWRRIEEEYWSVVRAIGEGISFPPERVAMVEKLSKEVEEILLVPGRFRQEATALVRCSKTSPMVTIELVGKEACRKVNEIFSYLMLDNIFIIGVYGMGGVGKTAILKYVYNRLLEDLTLDLFWVAVPQDFSVYALQEAIANAVGLDNLSDEKDVKRRACLLYGHLTVKNRSILILDGLWMHFEVKDVGIPVERGRLKLLVTTRSLDVCRMMLCQKQIKIELLDMEDSRRLFSKTLCFAGELPLEAEQIARSLLDRCCGLPLGIIEIATHMRGVDTVHEWRAMLGTLKDSRMELDVFKRLQLSYLNLGDDEVQQTFLHLILCFGEYLFHSGIPRKELIESFIDEGLLGGITTRQGLHNRGNTILDKIRGACLLDPEKECLHPLTMDMAFDIVSRTTHMVKAFRGLKEIPEEVFWTDRLERVFLQGNNIEEIPDGISPNCPKLMRLSLNNNDMLRVIHESFFRHLKGLTVLDLSYTRIAELPDSISQLESLEALLLQDCMALRFIPFVGKLGSLRKLDLQGCLSLDEVPEGMEMLVNLRYLALDGTNIETLPEGVLGKLVNLQYLAIEKLRAGEEIKSKEVDALYCSVADVETFNACVGSLERNSCQMYRLVMNAPSSCSLWAVDGRERSILIDGWDHIAARVDGTSGDGCALLPESVQSLELSRCHKMKRWEWLTTHLPNLKEIIIYSCEKLEEIIPGPLPSGATCCLTYLKVNGCNNMKRALLTQDVLLHLPFLQEILVKDCKGIEVIVGTVAKVTHYSFPKLMNLRLWNLPELKSICDGTTSCDSLQQISIDNCPKLKRIPLRLPLLDNGLPSPPPSLREIQINRQTWELLEWDHLLAHSSLEPFVKLLD